MRQESKGMSRETVERGEKKERERRQHTERWGAKTCGVVRGSLLTSLSLISSHSFQDPRTEFRKAVQSYLSKLSSNRNRSPTRATSAPTEGEGHKPNHGITKITRYGVRLVVVAHCSDH